MKRNKISIISGICFNRFSAIETDLLNDASLFIQEQLTEFRNSPCGRLIAVGRHPNLNSIHKNILANFDDTRILVHLKLNCCSKPLAEGKHQITRLSVSPFDHSSSRAIMTYDLMRATPQFLTTIRERPINQRDYDFARRGIIPLTISLGQFYSLKELKQIDKNLGLQTYCLAKGLSSLLRSASNLPDLPDLPPHLGQTSL